MSDQYEPRSDPHGRFVRTCKWCGNEFRTNNPRSLYCTEQHKKAAADARYYERHTDEQKARAMASKRRRRESK